MQKIEVVRILNITQHRSYNLSLLLDAFYILNVKYIITHTKLLDSKCIVRIICTDFIFRFYVRTISLTSVIYWEEYFECIIKGNILSC